MPQVEIEAPEAEAVPSPELRLAAAAFIDRTEEPGEEALAELDRLLAEAGLSAGGSTEDKLERLKAWNQEQAAADERLVQLVEEIEAYLKGGGEDEECLRALAEEAGLEPESDAGGMQIQLRAWLEAVKAEEQTEEQGLVPRWLTKEQQPELFDKGPLPLDLVDLKPESAIDGYCVAMVLARHDPPKGHVEYALAPLGADSVPLFPIVGHRRVSLDLDETNERVVYARVAEDVQAEWLSWWRQWMRSGRPLHCDLTKQNANLEAILEARERLRAAAAHLEHVKQLNKQAKATHDKAQEDLVEAVDKASKAPVWPREEV